MIMFVWVTVVQLYCFTITRITYYLTAPCLTSSLLVLPADIKYVSIKLTGKEDQEKKQKKMKKKKKGEERKKRKRKLNQIYGKKEKGK